MKIKLTKDSEETELTKAEEKIYWAGYKNGRQYGLWKGITIGAIIFWAIASIGIAIFE